MICTEFIYEGEGFYGRYRHDHGDLNAYWWLFGLHFGGFLAISACYILHSDERVMALDCLSWHVTRSFDC